MAFGQETVSIHGGEPVKLVKLGDWYLLLLTDRAVQRFTSKSMGEKALAAIKKAKVKAKKTGDWVKVDFRKI